LIPEGLTPFYVDVLCSTGGLLGGYKMKPKLSWLFHTLTFVGIVAFTLAFFNFGRDFFDRYVGWFLASLWIGMIGNSILKRYKKKQNKR
jgi:uncharacterized membrane protein YjjB (DUF3815 family)